MQTLPKIIAILTVIIGVCISIALILIAANVEKLTPQELQLTSAMLNLIVLEIKLLIPLSLFIACISITWSFLPKKTDDPIIRLVKTVGLTGGLLLALLMSLTILK